MCFEKSNTKSENVILRKRDLKGFGQKLSIFGFQQKYVESIYNGILTQIKVSSDDSTSNYSEKLERYTTNRNHTQSNQTWFPALLYNRLLSHVMSYYLCWFLVRMLWYTISFKAFHPWLNLHAIWSQYDIPFSQLPT